MAMNHQPKVGPVERADVPIEMLKAACGGCIAFVLASDEGTTPLKVEFEDTEKEPVICEPEENEEPTPRPLQIYEGKPCVQRAVETACASQVAGVVVMTSAALLEEVERAVACADCGDVPVRTIVRDFHREREATLKAANFEVYGLAFGLISAMHEEALQSAEVYQSLLVLSCDQLRITPAHIHEACADAQEHDEAEIVTSWIRFFPRKPIIVKRAFVERLGASGLLERLSNGTRPLPHLVTHEHEFGEERLGANPAVPPAVEEFLSELEERMDDYTVDVGYPDENELAWADAFGARCRLDFPLLNRQQHKDSLVYLDNAATTQRCSRALDAQREYDENSNANVYRGTYELSMRSSKAFANSRRSVEEFIGAEKNSVAFTLNASNAIATVFQAWAWTNLKPGDVIALSLSEHHSSIVPSLIGMKHLGIRVVYIEHDERGRIDRTSFSAALAEKPRLVCLAHVSNVFGIVEPVRELVDEAHEAGSRVLVDATQSLPHIPLDVAEIGADWLVFSGHKAYGPLGIGCLWYSEEAAAEMDPLFAGGGTIAHVARDSYYLRERPIQFELGTPPVSQAVGLAAALEYLSVLGMDDVRRHEAVLTRYLVQGLRRIEDVMVIGDHDREDGQVGLVALTLPGRDSMDVVGFLAKAGIATRGGGHCALPLHACLGLSGTVRASMGVYTTKSDIDALLAAVNAYSDLTALV